MADGSGMSKEDLRRLAEELSKLNKGSGPATSSAAPAATLFSDSLTKAKDTLNPFTAGLSLAGKSVDLAKQSFDAIKSVVTPGLDTFRELSKTGASFSNDIVGMTVASKGMRLSLDEFQDVIKNNAANFTGLGGNVTRGAEAFARLSEDFMDSPFIDSLKQAGYTNKELNEVLALQMSMQRYTYKEDEASRKAAIDSAGKLANEMDLQAKLTGKSREEQMANMKKAREDMQIEAKMRQIGIEKGPEAEAAARAAFAQQMNEAQLRGTEQLFKESILYGTAVSKEAAMQSITAGQGAFQAQLEAGRAFSKGEFEKSAEYSAKTQTEIIAFQRTSASNQIAMLPVQNELTSSSHKLMKANQGYYDALAKLQQMDEHKGKSTQELDKEAKRLAKEAADGLNAQSKEVSGATKAMINFESRAGDAEAALYKKLVLPLNEQVGPALGNFTRQALGRDVKQPGKEDTTYYKAVGEEITKGMNQQSQTRDPRGWKYDVAKETPSPILGGGILRDTARLINEGAGLATTGIEKATSAIRKKSYYAGTPGLDNQLVVDFGAETEALLHGRKAVLNEKQLLDMSKGISTATLNDSFKNLKNVSISGNHPTNMQTPMASMISALEKTKTSGLQDAIAQQSRNAAEESKPPIKESKGATLDDLLASMNSLNTKMTQLVDTHEDIGTKQIRATKSNNSNLFARA